MRDTRTKSTKRRKRVRSYPIIVLTSIYLALFIAMLGYISHYSLTHKQEFINNEHNTRQKILLKQNQRGKILSRDGDILAYSEKNEDGKEVRVYPYSNEFSHVVGYVSKGKAGIEGFSNYYLINTNLDLSKKVAYDAKGQKYPADNVKTTLDVHLQEVAYSALSSRKGAVVVSDPKTGEILAMVSKPDFDPNTLEQEWDQLIQDKSPDAKLLNRATQGKYPPGSTFKIVTALGYLREHPTDYMNYRFSCGGRFDYEGNTISCYHGEKHGNIDLETSFAKSCNSSFANIGVGLKSETFDYVLGNLMFNEELPLDFCRSAVSSSSYPKDGNPNSVMQLSIGQGKTSISPEHLNMITCAVANDGILMKPYVVSEVKSEDGKEIKKFAPEEYKRLMSDDEAKILRGMMEQVVQKGTASKLKGLSYTAAGKTGSAEFNDTKDSHAWFTGFAPADDPQVCVTIIVEEAGSGGSYAVPIAKRVFDAYFGVE
ncbi:penicillin-binding protein 2 [Butyrivibrio sp. X503]|nr:penicillin-binding protein 2 [Butyrivibrio sp. X503]